jgi:Zn-dependent metalloprotease
MLKVFKWSAMAAGVITSAAFAETPVVPGPVSVTTLSNQGASVVYKDTGPTNTISPAVKSALKRSQPSLKISQNRQAAFQPPPLNLGFPAGVKSAAAPVSQDQTNVKRQSIANVLGGKGGSLARVKFKQSRVAGIELSLDLLSGSAILGRSGSQNAVAIKAELEVFLGALEPELRGAGSRYQMQTKGECHAEICVFQSGRSLDGLPIFRETITSVTTSSGRLFSVHGAVEPAKATPELPSVRSSGAADINVLAATMAQKLNKPIDAGVLKNHARGWFANPAGDYALVDQVDVIIALDNAYRYWVSVDTGNVLDSIPLFMEETFVQVSGIDLSGNYQSFNAELRSGTYLSRDNTFPNPAVSEFLDAGNLTPDDANFQLVYGSTNLPNQWDPAIVSAVVNSRNAYNYYLQAHGRDGLDNQGTALIGIVHWGVGFNNAFFSDVGPGYMVYGDGDGQVFSNLAESQDVAGHELTHGVVSRSSGLEYRFQSGALNESFADYFGAAMDPEDWLIGEDIDQRARGYLRNMQNPNLANQPAHMDQYQNLTEDQDHGGVHINSGIPNRAMYLLSEGLTLEGLGTSLVRSDAEALIYNTMISLTPTSDFDDAANLMRQIAENTMGSTAADSVVEAWGAVGIDLAVVDTGTETTPRTYTQDTVVLYNQLDEQLDHVFKMQRYQNADPSTRTTFTLSLTNASGLPLVPGNVQSIFPMSSNIYRILTPDANGNVEIHDVDLVGLSITRQSPIDFPDDNILSVAVSPNGRYIALVIENSTTIYVWDNAIGQYIAFDVAGPDYSETGGLSPPVQMVDSLHFDMSSRKLAFDFSMCGFSEVGADCSVWFWSIGVADLGTGSLIYPIRSQDPDIDYGFPRFSRTTDQFVAIDVRDYRNGGFQSAVLNVNLYTGQVAYVYNPNGACDVISNPTQAVWGMPSYSADDSKIVGAYCYPGAAYEPVLSLWSPDGAGSLTTNALTLLPMASPTAPVLPDIQLSVDINALDFGLVFDTPKSIELCWSNQNNYMLSVGYVLMPEGLSSTIATDTLFPGEQKCDLVTVDPKAMTEELSGDLVIIHDAGAAVIPISGQLDTDGDGVPDSADDDDDNDNVPDAEDAFPKDPNESADTDNDGVGNNADLDDDGDGVPDAEELSQGTDPLDATDYPIDGGLSPALIKAAIDAAQG